MCIEIPSKKSIFIKTNKIWWVLFETIHSDLESPTLYKKSLCKSSNIATSTGYSTVILRFSQCFLGTTFVLLCNTPHIFPTDSQSFDYSTTSGWHPDRLSHSSSSTTTAKIFCKWLYGIKQEDEMPCRSLSAAAAATRPGGTDDDISAINVRAAWNSIKRWRRGHL